MFNLMISSPSSLCQAGQLSVAISNACFWRLVCVAMSRSVSDWLTGELYQSQH